MVGQLIRLKLRIMWNDVQTSRRPDPVAHGASYGLAMVGALYVGVGALRIYPTRIHHAQLGLVFLGG